MSEMFQNSISQIKLNSEFNDAVMTNDLKKIEELFSSDKSDNQKPFIDAELNTATGIFIAAQNKNWDIVKFLFNEGAKLEVCIAPQNWYLINECMMNAPENITNAIIDESDVNVKNSKGENPLMIAIKRQKGIVADYILENGKIDISAVNNDLENVAHYAAREGNNDMFLKLVKAGVNLSKKNKNGETPIDLIQDSDFKMSLAVEFEKIANDGHEIVLKEKSEETDILDKPVEEKPIKKVSGLSSIKKK